MWFFRPWLDGWWKGLKEDLNEVTARTANVWRASFLLSFDGTFFHSPRGVSGRRKELLFHWYYPMDGEGEKKPEREGERKEPVRVGKKKRRNKREREEQMASGKVHEKEVREWETEEREVEQVWNFSEKRGREKAIRALDQGWKGRRSNRGRREILKREGERSSSLRLLAQGSHSTRSGSTASSFPSCSLFPPLLPFL